MASLVKSGSAPDLLVPQGYSIVDLPSDFVTAMEQAFRILSWQENLSSKDQPPVWMWTLDWEIENWFHKLNEDRENNGNSSAGRDKRERVDSQQDNVFADRFK